MESTLHVISKSNYGNYLKVVELIFDSIFSIHSNPKEYGFGQSLLHEEQLVFHTPPYSLQPVSLQECYEYINKVLLIV